MIFDADGIAFSRCMSTYVFVAKYRRRVFDGPAIDTLRGIKAPQAPP